MQNLWKRRYNNPFIIFYLANYCFQRSSSRYHRRSPESKCYSFELWNRSQYCWGKRHCFTFRKEGIWRWEEGFFLFYTLYGTLILQNLKKVIELPMLNSRTDCLALAREIVNQCDLIHHSRVPEVEQTIFYLKKRKLSHGISKGKSETNL